jgi:hypothetical protein
MTNEVSKQKHVNLPTHHYSLLHKALNTDQHAITSLPFARFRACLETQIPFGIEEEISSFSPQSLQSRRGFPSKGNRHYATQVVDATGRTSGRHGGETAVLKCYSFKIP